MSVRQLTKLTQTPQRVCIVTPGYLSNTPRVVKEADALHKAGFSVRVAFSQGNMENIRVHDELLLKNKPWRAHSFGWSSYRGREKFLFHTSRLRHFIMRKLPSTFWTLGSVVEMAEGRVYPELAYLASSEPADLFIGHYLDGLAAAAYAARRWKSFLGYDAEDLHSEFGTDLIAQQRAQIIESRYISRCDHRTAASELMAQRLGDKYQIAPPVPIYNVFPWSDRNELDGRIKDRQGEPLSIYWYSQTIGLDRGIQDVIRAAGIVDAPIQIHLRGALSESVRQTLTALAEENGVGERLHFHERVPPTELLSRAVEHDVGLATEHPVDVSRQISVTNKLFFYLLAGLCVVATDVPGQRHVMDNILGAGYLYSVGDSASLARILNNLVHHPEVLKRSKETALSAARVQWNWETESLKLIEAVTTTLNHRQPNGSVC